jgi:uncharacterized protein YdaU (DUF1376 family)
MKSNIYPDMPLLVNDWLASTTIAAMTPAEEGGYIRLLCHAWNNEDCSLPSDDAFLKNLSRFGEKWVGDAKNRILSCFVVDEKHPDRIYNKKQRGLKREQLKRIKAAHTQAVNAVNTRWNNVKNKQYVGNTHVLPEKNVGNTPDIPLFSVLSTGTKVLPPLYSPQGGEGVQADPDLAKQTETEALAVYAEYPRKVGKPSALRQIRKAILRCGFARVLELTKNFARARSGEESDFTPHPSTWFSQERYLDDPATWKPNGKPAVGPTSDVGRRLAFETEKRNLIELIRDSPANPDSAFYQPAVADEEVEKLKKWRRRVTEITKELAGVKL